jgi:hypothetical protein
MHEAVMMVMELNDGIVVFFADETLLVYIAALVARIQQSLTSCATRTSQVSTSSGCHYPRTG